MASEIEIVVNGAKRRVTRPPDRPLLEVLREELDLTGTKYGCGEGECGACTVLVDGRAVRSCRTSVGSVRGRAIQTIEGLADDGELHPVQRAFLERGGMQCGFCTPGMILSTVALLRRNPEPTPQEVVRAMNGNLCRCCGYPAILASVMRASELSQEAGS